VRVANFRSVEDSGEFEVGQILCLVGKNEAGKSAIEQALACLNPHPLTPIDYNLERDYPRRWLTQYEERHGKEQATVVTTKWQLTTEERNLLAEQIGESAVLDQPVEIYRRFLDSEPQWRFPIEIQRAIDNLIEIEKLDEDEQKPLLGLKTTKDLIAALDAVAERTNKQERLLARVSAYPGKTITGMVKEILEPRLPQFLYSAHYDRMVGQLRLDNYGARLRGQIKPGIEVGEELFLDFLEFAGTSLDEINSAKTYEGLNARCEAASNRITLQLQEYWTQNPTLEIEVRVTKAEPNDQPPFNEGIIARARVRNNLHKLTLPFSERSAGFIWFFSFLVKFAQVRKTAENLILVLDEPGLTLHGKAQADLLRYFTEKLAPNHQVIFTTHSPFMVPPDDLPSVRIVEDRLLQPQPGRYSSEGTRVRDDTLVTDRDTLFPLQGALGYEITQTLFVGKHTLLVEGPGDILYLQAWSSALKRLGESGLDRRWTICPAGGIDRIQPFVALFSGQKLEIAALTDFAKGDRRKLDVLRQNKVLETDRLLTFASVLGLDEADIEDVFAPGLYASILNQAFNLPTEHHADPERLIRADPTTTRLLKRAEAYFRVLPPENPDFDHFTPAQWLFLNPSVIDSKDADVIATLDRARIVISKINGILGSKHA
jgi:energy-coupling factor transporter ATP-binding protein EcfA2